MISIVPARVIFMIVWTTLWGPIVDFSRRRKHLLAIINDDPTSNGNLDWRKICSPQYNNVKTHSSPWNGFKDLHLRPTQAMNQNYNVSNFSMHFAACSAKIQNHSWIVWEMGIKKGSSIKMLGAKDFCKKEKYRVHYLKLKSIKRGICSVFHGDVRALCNMNSYDLNTRWM